MDVGVEICSLQNFDSAGVAKEPVQAPSPSFAAIERDPQRTHFNYRLVIRKAV
jgi:hypothetical protein